MVVKNIKDVPRRHAVVRTNNSSSTPFIFRVPDPSPRILIVAQASQSAACEDKSRYCKLVKSFKMCQIPKYQVQCCVSCGKEA